MTFNLRDRTDRRGFLECVGWAGTGAVFTLAGGVAASTSLDRAVAATLGGRGPAAPSLSFVQISDSHIGFKKPANPDVIATLNATISRIKALPQPPQFVVHTGDITHLATPEQFDTAQQLLGQIGVPVFYVPGEHDIIDGNNPRPYLDRFGRNTRGDGWYSFDAGGVHFVGLINVLQFVDAGTGKLGTAQLDWLKADLAPLTASTPVVVLSHFPLWPLFPAWGWTTSDGGIALGLLRRFGSVTLLNGHIHQLAQKVEGNLVFHAGRSTAYPQPAPGVGPGPGPLVVAPDRLAAEIGLSTVAVRTIGGPIPILDATLA